MTIIIRRWRDLRDAWRVEIRAIATFLKRLA
jgi:hypothetical protein